MSVKWIYSQDKKQIVLPDGKPNRLLKVTGTRFAGILGMNKWNTPFQMWCEITKSARLPFEDNKYTIAGKAIEPKVVNFIKETLYEDTLDPEEYFGSMLYRDIKYDFYKDERIFGGMWDCAMVSAKNPQKIRALGEVKTSSRPQDWEGGPPLYYLLQVCEYAYLSGVDKIFLTASFLKDEDYGRPELFVPTDENTKIYSYSLSEITFPLLENGKTSLYTFEELVEKVLDWYRTYVDTGISPPFDEEKDAEYLKILRQASPKNDNDITQVIEELNKVNSLIDSIMKDKELGELEKRAKTLKENLKSMMMEQLGPNDTNVSVMNYKYAQSKPTLKVDEKKLKAAGLFDIYAVEKPGSWRLTQIKGDN